MPVSARLLGRLERVCGSRHVLTHRHALATYRSDGLAQYQVTPAAAVLPGTGEEVRDAHFYPLDPSSQTVCSIGGNVAENWGGAHCFKYGFTTNYVIGLELVLTDGEVPRLARDDPGYDLLGAFVGSEGTLGVATRITLRVTPAPEHVLTLVAVFEHTAQAGEAVTAIVSAGSSPGRSR
jgi:FAD/FMN-containing dehydrogenase